jgi:hypothetical protein
VAQPIALARRTHLGIRLPHDCRCLVRFVADAEIMQEAGIGDFASTDDMISRGLGLDPQEIRLAVDWLRIADPDHPVPLDVAVLRAKRGRPRNGENPANSRFSYGTTSGYTLARLRRDRPDLAAMVSAGELSANAAAIEAGFRKQPTALAQVMKLLPRLTAQERQQVNEATAPVRRRR